MNFSHYKVQKALRQIIDIAKKAEQSCFPLREVIHPSEKNRCRSLMLRVEMRLEEGPRLEYVLAMDPHNTHIARGKESESQSQFSPQFLTITGMVKDISCRKYPGEVLDGRVRQGDGGVVESRGEEGEPVPSATGDSSDGAE